MAPIRVTRRSSPFYTTRLESSSRRQSLFCLYRGAHRDESFCKQGSDHARAPQPQGYRERPGKHRPRPSRAALLVALGVPLTDRLGYASTEVEKVYSRARDLCSTVSDTPTLLPVLHGLYRFYIVHGQLHTARDIVQQLIKVAEETGNANQNHRPRGDGPKYIVHLGEIETAAGHL